MTEERKLSRRSLLKWSAAAGAAAFINGSLPVSFLASEKGKKVLTATEGSNGEKIVWSACTVNCGSRCPLRLHVKDGVITLVETDNTGDDKFPLYQVRACLRGRTIRKRIYNPDRLKYPMKRIGQRGEGKFESISRDEALTLVAGNLIRIRKLYGNEAIYINYATQTHLR